MRANFPLWSKPGEPSFFKPFATDEMWSEAGEREAFLWFIEPDYEGGQPEPSPD